MKSASGWWRPPTSHSWYVLWQPPPLSTGWFRPWTPAHAPAPRARRNPVVFQVRARLPASDSWRAAAAGDQQDLRGGAHPRGADGRWVPAASAHLQPPFSRLLFPLSWGAAHSSPERSLWLGVRTLLMLRRVSSDAKVGACWQDGPSRHQGRPLRHRGWPLRILGASGRRGGPSGRRWGLWGPRMVFLPRLPGPLPSNRGCGLHPPRVPFGPSGSPATGLGPRPPPEASSSRWAPREGAPSMPPSFVGPHSRDLSESGRLGPPPTFSSRSLSPPGYCFLLVSGLGYFAQKLRFSLGILIVVYHFPLAQKYYVSVL